MKVLRQAAPLPSRLRLNVVQLLQSVAAIRCRELAAS
jgi:hypothetical protein